MRILNWLKARFERASRGSPLQPESSYRVEVDDLGVRCTNPRGETSAVSFAELRAVMVHTNDQGPMLPDVFWVLLGDDVQCVVPQGATGEKNLMDKLFELPGFRFEEMTAAMRCTENQNFVCWRRDEATG
jgi:hypothetical protein